MNEDQKNTQAQTDKEETFGDFAAHKTEWLFVNACCFVAPVFVGAIALDKEGQFYEALLNKDGKISKSALFSAGAGAGVSAVTYAMLYSHNPAVAYAFNHSIPAIFGGIAVIIGLMPNMAGAFIGAPLLKEKIVKSAAYENFSRATSEVEKRAAHGIGSVVEPPLRHVKNGFQRIANTPMSKIRNPFRKEL